jgi:hypothetical protein
MTDRMQKPLLYLLAVLCAFLVGDRLLSYAGRMLARPSNMPLAELYSGRGAGDILILGNSRAVRHFDAQTLSARLGMPVRNYALLGASAELMEVLLHDYIERYGAPRMVVFEISCLGYGPGQEVAQRLYRSDSAGLDELLRAANPALYYVSRIANLLDLNSDTFLNTLHKVLVPYPSTLLTGELQQDAAERLAAEIPSPYFTILPANSASLARISALAKANNIVLLPVLTPVLPQLQKRLNEIDPFVADAASAANRTVADFTNIQLPAASFHDPVHLNGTGAIQIQDAVISAIESRLPKRSAFTIMSTDRPAL